MQSGSQPKDTSEDFLVEDTDCTSSHPVGLQEKETNPHRLAQRQKQIDFGKNTLGYQRYRDAVPKSKRRRREDPATPDIHKACSKRAFDGLVKKWRRQLHAWDPPAGDGESGIALKDAVVETRSMFDPEEGSGLPENENSLTDDTKKDKAATQAQSTVPARHSFLPVLLGGHKRSAEQGLAHKSGAPTPTKSVDCTRKQARMSWLDSVRRTGRVHSQTAQDDEMEEVDYSFSSDEEGMGWMRVTPESKDTPLDDEPNVCL